MIRHETDRYIFHSKKDFRTSINDHIVQYLRDAFGDYPEWMNEEIQSIIEEYTDYYEYPAYAIEGFSSSDLAQIIARIFDEVSVPLGGLNEPHDELPVEV